MSGKSLEEDEKEQAISPDDIPVEVRRCLRDMSEGLLGTWLNRILDSNLEIQ